MALSFQLDIIVLRTFANSIDMNMRASMLTYLLNCKIIYRGQAQTEFKVEVEAIGKVKHKNLVGLIGYCAEGAQR